MDEKNAVVIAVAGKGGVGKTSISANIVRCLVDAFPNKRILAIDADPAVGLATALGIEPKMTIDDIRKNIVENVEGGNKKEAIELLGEVRYKIFDALVEKSGFSFVAVGRPEAEGCYCKINSYLKEVITLVSEQFDYVVIDGEAGIEQINRRVMEKVTYLILVTDPSKKGTQVVQTIKKVADELVMYKDIAVIVNRLSDVSLKDFIDTGGIKILSYIDNDNNLALCDVKGQDVLNLSSDSSIVCGVKEALQKLNIL
ncbi:MAG: AAA family ATPase [Treponemataceae bacterium]